MIGLDAAEWTLIEPWMREGRLPALAELRRRGASIRLEPSADWMVGALWPSFFTGRGPEQFGMYHSLVWRPDQMRTERPAPSWMPIEPFWRALPSRGRRVIVVDVPLCYPPEPYPGIEVSGWATHELIQKPGSSPSTLLRQIRREFGVAPLRTETSRRLNARSCLAVTNQCRETARLVRDAAAALLHRHPWDLALICFSSLHRAGHLLWDRTILEGQPAEAELERFDRALGEVYQEVDAAVGHLVDQAGPDTTVMAFSLHGMGPNTDRTCLLSEMLARILRNRSSEGGSVRPARISDRLRRLVPEHWRARSKEHFPQWLKDRLTVHWRTPGSSWANTSAFVAFCDLDGFIRINLRGREREGIVDPADFRALCDRIVDGLGTFRDGDTGEPLVALVDRGAEIFGEGPMRHHMPDLVVRWVETPAIAHRTIVSDRHGWIPWPTPGRHPAGRAGNHRRPGFLIAAGGAFDGATLPPTARIIDLAPHRTRPARGESATHLSGPESA